LSWHRRHGGDVWVGDLSASCAITGAYAELVPVIGIFLYLSAGDGTTQV